MNGTDPDQVELSPPLPGDALRAKVTFLRARAGFGFKSAPRSEATHARIEETGPDGTTRDRRLEVADVSTYLAEVDSMHDGGKDERASLRVECPHCAVARAYVGESNAFHQYACPRCGSVELFRRGVVEHPLPSAG